MEMFSENILINNMRSSTLVVLLLVIVQFFFPDCHDFGCPKKRNQVRSCQQLQYHELNRGSGEASGEGSGEVDSSGESSGEGSGAEASGENNKDVSVTDEPKLLMIIKLLENNIDRHETKKKKSQLKTEKNEEL
ncbi:hypothetical protein DICVIV_11195 [Dictyocaulus viviparus]|uniref:Uncharacterized protein n=1 Tax=Dictyocaulus viviparus TaxID=29172 RepID=A0A0D8XGD4_DICVI|nr:hypothetical protein DICVIV_11195 [Dictyocaulus viviparus]